MTKDLCLTENNVRGQMVSEGHIKDRKLFPVTYVEQIIMTLLLQSDMCLGLLAETGTDIHTVDIVYTSAVTLRSV